MARGFLGGHAESYRAALLNTRDAFVQKLGLKDGSLDWNTFREIKGGGEIVVSSEGLEDFDWLDARVSVTYRAEYAEQVIEKQMFVGVVANAKPIKKTGTVSLTLLDKLAILKEDSLSKSTSYPEGTVVTDAVKALIQTTGESKIAIEESTETLRAAMVFEIGDSKLKVANALLGALNYGTLWVDGAGVFRAEKYQDVDARDVVHVFEPGPYATFTDDIEDDRDLFNIPNRVVCVSTSNGEVEAISAVAENNDPANRYSIPRRGRIITRREEGVEATSLSVLRDIASKLLLTSSLVTWRQTINHLWLDLELGQVVLSTDGKRFSIVEMQQPLTAGALAQTVVRRMDTVGSR